MDASRRQRWLRAALLAGVAYFLIGRGFAAPTSDVRAWRLAAWLVSGIVFAAHIGYEHFRIGHSPRFTALHAALGVALGAFGLAVAGAVHSLETVSTIRLAWLVAFVAWPLITAVPAFLVALVAGTLLERLPRRADVE